MTRRVYFNDTKLKIDSSQITRKERTLQGDFFDSDSTVHE